MFISLLRNRRSIRKYQKKPVEAEKIAVLIEAALRTPSSRGLEPWEFVVVTSQKLLERLSQAKPHGASFLRTAPLGIVVCADPAQCDVWIEDCSLVSLSILLAAESLGLGGCWVQIRERMHDETVTAQEYVAQLLNIPAGYMVESIIAVGYPDEKKQPRKKEDLGYEKVYQDSYGKALSVAER